MQREAALERSLKARRDELTTEQQNAAIERACHLRSSLEAEGYSRGDIVSGAQQVLTALLRQWVAEDDGGVPDGGIYSLISPTLRSLGF